jgi:hypothetical protein
MHVVDHWLSYDGDQDIFDVKLTKNSISVRKVRTKYRPEDRGSKHQ